MTTKKLFFGACLIAAFATICLPAVKLCAQSPPLSASSQPSDSGLDVTIKSGSGKERYPLSQDGRIDRIGLRPGQTVAIKLKFKGKKTGQPLSVSSLDGGELSGRDSLSLSSDGNAQFSYQGGPAPGLYRLLVQIGAEEYWFEFYVLDLNNPQNNPPRVRVVD